MKLHASAKFISHLKKYLQQPDAALHMLHAFTQYDVSLVPRPLPLLQCCTQKRGKAWEAKSRECDCTIALYTKDRTVPEPY